MTRFFKVIATFAIILSLELFTTTGLRSASYAQGTEDGVVRSHFEVVNNSDERIEVQIYKNSDRSCAHTSHKTIVSKNSRKKMRCGNKASNQRNRCKIIVRAVSKNKLICKNLRNECNRDAIRMPDSSRITIDTDTSKNSGFTCKTVHDVTF